MKKYIESISEEVFGKHNKLGILYTYLFIIGLFIGAIGMSIYLK